MKSEVCAEGMNFKLIVMIKTLSDLEVFNLSF